MVTVGVFTGDYKSMAIGANGKMIETTVLRVRPFGCEIPMGCPRFTPDKTPGTGTKHIEFYNTTDTCPHPKPVSVAVGGNNPGAAIPPGGHVTLEVPDRPTRLEVLDAGQRLMVTCTFPRVQKYEYYGCSDPKYTLKEKGVVVTFRNSTQTCGTNGGFPVVLWIDGFPVKALKPETDIRIGLSKGSHRFRISRGLSDRALFDRSMDCERSFLFNYGCKKKK
jgi:hypothetical protein